MNTLSAIELDFTREELDDVFVKGYSPGKLITLLREGCKVEIIERDIIHIYDEQVHVGSLTLSQHSLAVLQRFEEFFAQNAMPGGMDINFFRLVLAMHDIGKPIGGIYGQAEVTITLVNSLLRHFNYPTDLIQFALALLSSDPVGYHLRGEASHQSLERVAQEIHEMANESGLPLKDFFDLLMIYYTVDASSYQHLSHLFKFDHEKKEIGYALHIATKIDSIRTAVFATL